MSTQYTFGESRFTQRACWHVIYHILNFPEDFDDASFVKFGKNS